MHCEKRDSARPAEPSRREVLKSAAWAVPLLTMTGAANRLSSAERSSDAGLLQLGAREVVERIRKGDLKAELYATQLLKQYNAHKDLNTVVTIDESRVLEAAREVDKARSRNDRLGPLAGLPFIARTFGSARICSRFLASSASMVAPRFRSGRYRNILSALDSVKVWVGTVPVLGAANCPVVMVPVVFPAPVLKRFAPMYAFCRSICWRGAGVLSRPSSSNSMPRIE